MNGRQPPGLQENADKDEMMRGYGMQGGSTSRLTLHQEHAGPSPMFQRLQHGEEYTISFEGTSQYAHGGLSSCGIAALNAVRVILCAEADTTGSEWLKELNSPDVSEHIMGITAYWSDAAHLDVNDIRSLPMFESSLEHKYTEGGMVSAEKFVELLRRLRKFAGTAGPDLWSSAVVLTRPPEIISIIFVPLIDPKLPGVFIVFDSHPRPAKGTTGASMIIFPSANTAASYLSELFYMDPEILSSINPYEAAQLSQYGAEFFVVNPNWSHQGDDHALYVANFQLLQMRNDIASERQKSASQSREISALKDTLGRTEERASSLEAELAAAKATTQEYQNQLTELQQQAEGYVASIRTEREQQQMAWNEQKTALEITQRNLAADVTRLTREIEEQRSSHEAAIHDIVAQRDTANGSSDNMVVDPPPHDFSRDAHHDHLVEMNAGMQSEIQHLGQELHKLRDLLESKDRAIVGITERADTLEQQLRKSNAELNSMRQTQTDRPRTEDSTASRSIPTQRRPIPAFSGSSNTSHPPSSMTNNAISGSSSQLGRSHSIKTQHRASVTPAEPETNGSEDLHLRLVELETELRSIKAEKEVVASEAQTEKEAYEKLIADLGQKTRRLESQVSHSTKAEEAAREAERLRRELADAEQKAQQFASERDGLDYQLLTLTETHASEMKTVIAAHGRRVKELIMELKQTREENMRLKMLQQSSQGTAPIENVDTQIPFWDPNDITISSEPSEPSHSTITKVMDSGLRAQSPASMTTDQYFDAPENTVHENPVEDPEEEAGPAPSRAFTRIREALGKLNVASKQRSDPQTRPRRSASAESPTNQDDWKQITVPHPSSGYRLAQFPPLIPTLPPSSDNLNAVIDRETSTSTHSRRLQKPPPVPPKGKGKQVDIGENQKGVSPVVSPVEARADGDPMGNPFETPGMPGDIGLVDEELRSPSGAADNEEEASLALVRQLQEEEDQEEQSRNLALRMQDEIDREANQQENFLILEPGQRLNHGKPRRGRGSHGSQYTGVWRTPTTDAETARRIQVFDAERENLVRRDTRNPSSVSVHIIAATKPAP